MQLDDLASPFQHISRFSMHLININYFTLIGLCVCVHVCTCMHAKLPHSFCLPNSLLRYNYHLEKRMMMFIIIIPIIAQVFLFAAVYCPLLCVPQPPVISFNHISHGFLNSLKPGLFYMYCLEFLYPVVSHLIEYT